MAKTELNKKMETKIEEVSDLRGTLTSVFFIGGIIVAFWVGVYSLYLSRF